MKKKVLVLATLFAATTTFAQDLTSRKGEPYLPESGDWAISFDAAPFLNFAGGVLGGNASAPTANYVAGLPWHIRGKMFASETMAYRAGLRLGFGSETYTSKVGQFNATAPTFPALPNMVEDEHKAGATNVVLSGGIEMRRGKTRLQGYYGGELFIGLMSTKDAFTYGNSLDAAGGLGTTPTTDFSSISGFSNITNDPYYGLPGRTTEFKTSSFMLGLRGFIGVEYFIMPKISIGAEYGWGLAFGNSKYSNSVETTNGTTVATITDDSDLMYSTFGFDTDINYSSSGQLNIIFHF